MPLMHPAEAMAAATALHSLPWRLRLRVELPSEAVVAGASGSVLQLLLSLSGTWISSVRRSSHACSSPLPHRVIGCSAPGRPPSSCSLSPSLSGNALDVTCALAMPEVVEEKGGVLKDRWQAP